MVSFSTGLLVFVAALTVAFLVAMLLSRRSKGAAWRPKVEIVNFALLSVCGLLILLAVFQYFWNTSVLYFALYPITVFLLLIALVYASASKKFYLLFLIVLLHLVVLSLVIPPSGFMLTERTPALMALDEAKTWNPNSQLLNPYYNPFPMDVGLFLSFSKITSIMYTEALSSWVISLFFVVAYDLVLFLFVKDLSGRWKVGVLSILLLTFMPPLALNPQPEWLAYLFVLIFFYGLFRALRGSPSFTDVVLVNLSYAVAILAHADAAIGAVVVTILLLLMFCGRRLGLNIATTSQQRSFVCLVTVTVYVLTLCRWVVLGGVDSVTKALSGFDTILNHGAFISTVSKYVPLYNQSVSPIIAYAWSVPISLAFAFLLYQVVHRGERKSLNVVFLLSMSLAGGVLVFGGFLGSMVTASSGLQRYLGYAGLTLLIPVAAFGCARILRSSSRKILCLCLIALVLFSAIGILDPAFSGQLYPGIQSVSPVTSADLIEGNTLNTILPMGQSIVSTYEILVGISYLETIPGSVNKTIYPVSNSLKTNRLWVDNLTDENEVRPDTVYIWTPEILQAANDPLLNVVYNSGRYVALESS